MDKKKSHYKSTEKSALTGTVSSQQIPQFQPTRISLSEFSSVLDSDLERISRITVSSGRAGEESLFPRPKPFIPSRSSNHFMNNLIKQRKRMLKRSSGMSAGSRNSIGSTSSFRPPFQQHYGRKMVITSQDLRKKLDARRKIQEEEERQKRIQQPDEKPNVGQHGLSPKKEDEDDGDDPVIILDTRGKDAGSTTKERITNKSFSKKSGFSESASSGSLLHLINVNEDLAAAGTDKLMSSNDADKRVTVSDNEKEVKIERVNVIPLYRKQHRAMPQYTAPVFTQIPKVTAPYQDKRFVMTEGGGFQGSFVSRSSIGVTFSTAKDDRRTCTSSSSVPLLPTPTLKKNGSGAGGAWKTYAQARTTEERSATSIPYQRHRSGKDIRINNYANPFNFDVRDESQRCAPGLIGESWHIPAKNSTVAESATSKCYETILTSYQEFDRLCKVTATEGSMFATECSPASFILTDSKWGNGLMPVMPRILPP